LDIWTLVISVGITAVISWQLYEVGIRHGNYKKFWAHIKRMRPIMFLTNLPVQVVTIVTGSILTNVVGLKWGWTSFLHSDGSTSNVNMIGFSFIWFVPVFTILIILALPHLAMFEEQMFREGTRGLGSSLIRSTLFGLMHLIAGISFGYALALIIPGTLVQLPVQEGRRRAIGSLPLGLEPHTRRAVGGCNHD
jgi:hypothetical protein